MWHMFWKQPTDAPSCVAQLFPQKRQLSGSFSRSVSQPFAGFSSQSPRPSGHWMRLDAAGAGASAPSGMASASGAAPGASGTLLGASPTAPVAVGAEPGARVAAGPAHAATTNAPATPALAFQVTSYGHAAGRGVGSFEQLPALSSVGRLTKQGATSAARAWRIHEVQRLPGPPNTIADSGMPSALRVASRHAALSRGVWSQARVPRAGPPRLVEPRGD